MAKYFLDEKIFLNEFDKLTGKKRKKLIYVVQEIIMILHNLGLDLGLGVGCYFLHNSQKYLQGEKYIGERFIKDGDRY